MSGKISDLTDRVFLPNPVRPVLVSLDIRFRIFACGRPSQKHGASSWNSLTGHNSLGNRSTRSKSSFGLWQSGADGRSPCLSKIGDNSGGSRLGYIGARSSSNMPAIVFPSFAMGSLRCGSTRSPISNQHALKNTWLSMGLHCRPTTCSGASSSRQTTANADAMSLGHAQCQAFDAWAAIQTNICPRAGCRICQNRHGVGRTGRTCMASSPRRCWTSLRATQRARPDRTTGLPNRRPA
jgi:hypothetical protein